MRSNFKLNRVTAAVMIATASMAPAQRAMAGAGYGDAYDLNQVPFIIQSYFATSPSGARLWTGVDPTTGADTGIVDSLTGAPAGYDPANRLAYKAAIAAKYPGGYSGTGKAIRKFVDTLPLPAGHALTTKFAANKTTLTDDATASKYIPVAVPKKWTNPQGVTTNDDYYEIAAVEYSEKFHSDLRKATTLRGYVQIDQEASNGRTPLPGSKSYRLSYPDGSAIMIAATDANGKLTGASVPALAVDQPHYLGPLLTASQNTPTRVKFLNLLPTGRAETTLDAAGKLTVALDASGKPLRHGDIFLPLDPSVPGSGFGPDGAHTYSQNRVNLHLHGGDNPWISDGGPHTWITPAGEADPLAIGSIASLNAEPAAGALDPTLVPEFLRGPGALNVPDMNDPGAGAMTYYFPNGQSSRMEWYHDHTVGITRLNVYAGLASAYFLTDATEQALINGGTVTDRTGQPVSISKVLPGPDDTIPLILQDKTFVPDDIALQDERWNVSAWGAPGDMWYPHVYETVQDPNQATNFNSVGRWHWGPWFWPSYPSAYNLPSGAYGDVTLTPEAWEDTPLVNGVAYPTITVEPKPYRMRILNASNDRTFSFNMFVADGSVTTDDGRTDTEMKMVPVNSWVNSTCADPAATRSTDGVCTPQSWSTDVYGHNGGVPDATTQGPTLYQIANEGGLLPGVAAKDPTPLSFLLDKGRAAVLNVDFGASGLLIGNAERADVVVDFSAYAGKTLLVYNDNGAPVPAADPRNEFFTGYGDQSATGGAEDTRPGYGPNSRTIMQIKVAAAPLAAVAPLDPVALDSAVKTAYKVAQETPVVAQAAYNGALGTSWTDNQSFAPIFVGSLKQPSFQFVPGTPSTAFNSILMKTTGSGYTRTPSVTLTGGNGTGATARASLKIDNVYVINGGSGYTAAPTVTITSLGAGSGAGATTTLKPTAVKITAGGSGYTSAPTVTFSKPTTAGGTQAKGSATVSGGVVTGVTIDPLNPGSGYASAPTISFLGGGGTGAKATSTGGVDAVILDLPDPTNLLTRGGGGYDNLSTSASEPANLTPGLTITFSAPPVGGVVATAGATGKVFDITLSNGGTGYTAAPTVAVIASPAEPVYSATQIPGNYTIHNQAIVAATAAADTTLGTPQGSFLVKTKAIQELFDPTYGRLNATFGVEIPFTSALTQTTIPLGYVDAPTEEIADGETQIWKITHNGVDTHPIHFHLVNVQLINRVGWDNFITPPEPNELGWKETIKMSPLEDVIVAVRAKKPRLPGFGLPNSYRLLDPSQPEGAMTGFTQIDANTGLPAPMSNTWQDFGWEYVWHCHILGHEENDFMRPIMFHANEAVPLAPTLAATTSTTTGVPLSWIDNASTEYKFDVMRADVLPDNITLGSFATVGSALANANAYFDATAVGTTNASGGTSMAYKVAAVGANGVGESGIVVTPLTVGPPSAPTTLAALAQSGSQVALSWTDNALNETGFVLQRTVNGVTSIFNLAQNTVSYTDTGLPADTLVSYQLNAVNGVGSSSVVSVSAYTLGAPALASLSATANSPTQVTLAWTPAAPVRAQAVTGYNIVRTGGAAAASFTAAANATGFVDTTGVQNTAYTYAVNAVNANGLAPVAGATSTTSVTTPYAAAGALTGLTAVSNAAATQVTVTWTGGLPATSYLVERCTATAANFNCTAASSVWLPAVTVNAPATSYADSAVAANTTYAYRVTGTNGSNPTLSNTVTATVTTPGGVTVIAPTGLSAVVSFTLGRISLTWTDAATNETAFIIERSTDGVNFSQVGTAAPRTGSTGLTRTFNDTAVSAGVTYFYRVRAQNVTGTVISNSPPSNVVKIDYFLSAPSGLTATIASATRITLNWVDTTSAEASFAVWRSDNGAAAVQIGTVNRTAAQATATGGAVTFNNNNGAAAPLVLGSTYTYYVTAVNGAVASPASATVSVAFVAPAAPAPLTATVTTTSATRATVVMNWATVAGATSYTVQRISPAGVTTTVVANTTALTFTQANVLRNGTAYVYQVRANGTAGSSAYTPTNVLVN